VVGLAIYEDKLINIYAPFYKNTLYKSDYLGYYYKDLGHGIKDLIIAGKHNNQKLTFDFRPQIPFMIDFLDNNFTRQ
jgi:hypothetical protein